jgi:hypothetical protein
MKRKNENKKKKINKLGKDNTWKTGSEAGIAVAEKEEAGSDLKKEEAEDRDEILDMFGNSDEDD